jgi:hypothetical protein
MSVLNRALSPAPRVSAEAIERALAAVAAQIEPDPLFRRRLRSEVVNRYVAAREGIAAPSERPAPVRRSRTGRLGRACLYASFGLAATAAGVLAAAQEALPGEALYGVKLRVEQLRFDVVPDHLHADLVAYALGERIEEMDHLMAAGSWDEAIALAPTIEHEFARLEALVTASSDQDEARIERHLVVLSGLLEHLPDAARSAVQDVVNGVNGLGHQGDEPNGDQDQNGGAGASGAYGATPAGGQGPGGATNLDDEAPAPDRTPRPEATQRPEPTPRPERTPRPEPTIKPAPDNPSQNEDDPH